MNREMSLKDRIRSSVKVSIAKDDTHMRDLLLDTLYEIKALESRVRGGNDYHTPECMDADAPKEKKQWGDRHAC